MSGSHKPIGSPLSRRLASHFWLRPCLHFESDLGPSFGQDLGPFLVRPLPHFWSGLLTHFEAAPCSIFGQVSVPFLVQDFLPLLTPSANRFRSPGPLPACPIALVRFFIALFSPSHPFSPSSGLHFPSSGALGWAGLGGDPWKFPGTPLGHPKFPWSPPSF